MPCMCVTRVIVSLVNNLYGKHEKCWFTLDKISVFYESEAWTNFWSHLTSDFEKTFFRSERASCRERVCQYV